MSWFLVILFLTLTFDTSFTEATTNHDDDNKKILPSAFVVGTVYCDTCLQQTFSKESHLISGASIAVECKVKNSKPRFYTEVKTNEHGEFKVKLPFSVKKHVKRIKRCSLRLISSSEPYCAIASATTSTNSLSLKKKIQHEHIFSAWDFSFKPMKKPHFCGKKHSFPNSKEHVFKEHKHSIANFKEHKHKHVSKKSDFSDQKDFSIFPPLIPNPFQPPPLIPNPLQPPSPPLIPNPFQPPSPPPFLPNPFQPPPSSPPPFLPNPFQPPPSSPPPSFPFPPIVIPGLTPSPPPPPPPKSVFPFPLPPLFPPPHSPGSPPTSSKHSSP